VFACVRVTSVCQLLLAAQRVAIFSDKPVS
jgi:hypothetical protein